MGTRKNRQFLGLKFRRQHQFGDYILDFYCHENRVAVEFDGKIHETRRGKDAKRDSYLSSRGVKVIRILNETFLADPAEGLKYLRDQLPLPLGEGQGEGKSSGALNTKNKVLMIDARNIYRKVTRKIYDFSSEQMQNLTSIVWLYRGQRDRFLNLVKQYLASVCEESRAIPAKITAFEKTLADQRERLAVLVKAVDDDKTLDAEKKKALTDATNELAKAEKPYEADRSELIDGLAKYLERFTEALPDANDEQHSARKAFDPIAEEIKGLIKQIDLLYKLAARATDLACDFSRPLGEGQGDSEKIFDARAARRFLKQLDEERKAAVEQLKQAAYFHRQIVWLQDRFPAAELQAVPGLIKLVDLKDIEAADWSLTPGRYVGVAPPEEDEDFDFEATLRDIHTELADLSKEAVEMAAKISENFEELGI